MEDKKRGTKDKEQGTENYVWYKKDKLGEGSFAVVFKGRHRKDNKEVAVKVCDVSKSEREHERLYIEDVQLLRTLDSPYITKYLADERVPSDTKRKRAIIMELGDGSLRSEILKEENRVGLPKHILLTLIDNCVRALECLDAHKISHRDIKPENILFFRKPRLTFKLSDFGNYLQVNNADESIHTKLGTLEYMPTSMIRQIASEDELSYTKDQYDIWATACCFFEAATGRRPFLTRSSGFASSLARRRFAKEMSELFKNRPSDVTCAQYDEQQNKYVYQKEIPEQHNSYSRQFRTILARYFQMMFNREKKFLNVAKFSALSQELAAIKEYRYYCLNSLTEEAYCDTEHSEFFPKKTLTSEVEDIIRSSERSQILPCASQEMLDGFICELTEKKLDHLAYRQPFLAAVVQWSHNGFPSVVATLFETSGGVQMEIQNAEGIRTAEKKGCTLLEIASTSMHPSLSGYLRRRLTGEMDVPENSFSHANIPKSRNTANGVSTGIDRSPARSSNNTNGFPAQPTSNMPAASPSEVKLQSKNKQARTRECGLDIRKTTDWTLLMSAAYEGQTDLAERLIEQGQDLNAKSRDYGDSALSIAASRGHTDIVRLLLRQGVEVNSRKRGGFTPLHGACEEGHLEIARCLLDNDASMTSKAVLGWTPLMSAAANGWRDISELLIMRGADPDTRAMNGDRALSLAAFYGHLETVKLLAEYSSITDRRNDGYTPLHLACQKGYFDIVSFLLHKGASAREAANDGLTALKVAEQNGHSIIVDLLYGWEARN